MTTTKDRDYVLGTHDEEIERLGLQHDVWRPRALAAWQRAGFNRGQTLLDVGCGPGYATLDLAELVGTHGRVIAVDRSRRFLDALEARRRARRIENVTVLEADLDDVVFDESGADGAWCRWVLAFVPRPRNLLERIAGALAPGGVFVSHEYFEYGTWRAVPRSLIFEEFVAATIANWRASGGEPDIGLDVPRWLEELGFEIESTRTIIDVISPRDYSWQWPASFMEIGLRRLIDLGAVTAERGAELERALYEVANGPNLRMITPGVLEVVARKR
jgi:ubiquinone/menaquinone biosynthesis C-methylase UbiE